MAADLQIYAPQKLWRTQVVNRMGIGNLAAAATEGFFYLPSGSGPPTGVPTQAPAGFVPIYWDHTDQKLYVYDGGWILTNPTAVILRSHLAGLGTANNVATPNTKIDVAAGQCADDTNAALLNVAAATIDCGTVGANGLDAGALAINTWYHAFAIAKAGGASAAFLASTSLNAPTLPATYTLKRRIGSFKTDGTAHILAFSQNGDEFLWAVPPTDVNAVALGTASTLYPLSVPPGIAVNALLAASAVAAANSSVLLQSPAVNTQAVSTQTAGSKLIIVNGSSGNGAGGQFNIRTDITQNIRAVASINSVTLSVLTDGWIDHRGRDA